MATEQIDLNFQHVPGSIASYALHTSDGLALVDPGPATTLSALEAGLGRLGQRLEDVRHVLLTHIHFDHAGAAGTIAARVPQAQIYVHERGAAHLARPEKLLASATQIYGDQMNTLWGEMRPIPIERLVVLSGGETLPFGGVAHYTPGHAIHHLAYHLGDDLFVGDVGGIRIDAAQTPRPPTPPPDIDLEAWARSISALRPLKARTLHLTHFGSYPHEAAHWDALERNIRIDAGRVQRRLQAGESLATIMAAFTQDLTADLRAEGEDAGRADLPQRFVTACPPWMGVQGLARYFQRKAARAGESA